MLGEHVRKRGQGKIRADTATGQDLKGGRELQSQGGWERTPGSRHSAGKSSVAGRSWSREHQGLEGREQHRRQGCKNQRVLALGGQFGVLILS